MTDPLLTSLCSICHASAPRYKCPRCSLQTCSVPCVKKHKTWSECSGERDETAYVPRSQLRTVSGIDHDYNFLHKLDMSVERAERVLVGDKGLLQPDELRRQTVPQVRWKTGRDGKKRKVVMTRVPHEAKRRKPERSLAQRLRQLNVHVVRAPMGMARQKENHTTFNSRSGGINWQVEWLAFDGGSSDSDPQGPRTTTRTLSKVLEHVPLYQAYKALQEEKMRAETRQPKRREKICRPEETQRPQDSRWNLTANSIQDPLKGHWVPYHGADIGESWPDERDEAQRRQFQFFLGGGPTAKVTALSPTDCLRDILANTRVREYPTLYVLKAGETLPAEFVLGPKDTIAQQQGTKRQGDPEPSLDNWQGSAKRRRQDGQDGNGLEEGEVGWKEGEQAGAERDAGFEGDDAGVERGEEAAGESWGEEVSDEAGDSDSTSSSGTDSESG